MKGRDTDRDLLWDGRLAGQTKGGRSILAGSKASIGEYHEKAVCRR